MGEIGIHLADEFRPCSTQYSLKGLLVGRAKPKFSRAMDDVHSSQGSCEPFSFHSGTIRRSVINYQETDRRGDCQNRRHEAGNIRDFIIGRDDYNGRWKCNLLHHSVTLTVAGLQPSYGA